MSEATQFQRSVSLGEVNKGELCSGCGLCAGVSQGAVGMSTVAPGFSRPIQQSGLTASQELAIAAACPGLVVDDWKSPSTDRKLHNSWGPYLACLTGHASDPQVRFRGSSGGAVSALAIHAVEAGFAARVLQVYQDTANPTRNIMQLSSTSEDILRGSGSRYAASSPLEDIGTLLDEGITTVFIGKPCDVSALRKLRSVDPRVDRVFPIMLSFFCGGIPSHDGADRIVEAMGMSNASLKNFRYRGEGWPGLTVAEDIDGSKATMKYENSWGDYLSKQVQFRCKICPDAVGGAADIACADAWYGGETGYPKFEEEEGRSLIMVRSSAGQALLQSALDAKALVAEELEISQVDLMQPAQARRKRRIAARVLASKILGKPTPKMSGLNVLKAAKEERVPALVKEFLGTLRRVLTRRF